MNVKVTADYRITLPKELREQLHIVPGQKVDVTVENGIIRMAFRPPEESCRGAKPTRAPTR